jgi:hypothetical protein
MVIKMLTVQIWAFCVCELVWVGALSARRVRPPC